METISAYTKPARIPLLHSAWLPLHLYQRKLLLASIDLAVINGVLLLGLHRDLDLPLSPATILLRPVWFATLTSLWLAIASATDNYDLKRTARVFTGTFDVLKAAVLTGVIYILLPLLSPPLPVARFPLFLLWGLGASGLALWRIIYATIFVQPNFQRRVLIVGAGWSGQTAAQVIREPNSGYQILGYVDDDETKQGQIINEIPVLGNSDQLTTLIQNHRISDIVLAITHDMPAELVRTALKCFEQGVRIVPMPELFEQVTGRIPVEHIGNRWLVSLPIGRDSRGLYPLIKRLMDIVISVLGLLILAPFFPLLALAIKLDSPGPIFYRPERLGRGGKPFRLWKFRTMVANADRLGDPTFTKKKDNRITRLGSFLRTTHLDELPQFINILKGEMSIVGPRPERYVAELEEAIPFYRTRYAVRPGTAGWALVKQGYADGVEDTLIKLQYDLYYIKHLSLSLDIRILVKTVRAMLTLRGR